MGFSLAKPTLDTTSRYDYIIDRDGELERVQIKTLRRRKNGNYELKCRATHRSSPDYVYTGADTDWIVGVDVKNSTIIWYPAKDIGGRTSIVVGTWHE